VLELRGLTRRFGRVAALDGVSFSVPEGQLLGFVGPNGAGKTTTMRIILGVLEPDAGEVRWRGRPMTGEARRRAGYMPEERGLYPKMRARTSSGTPTTLGRNQKLTGGSRSHSGSFGPLST